MIGQGIYKQLTFYSQNIHDSFFIFDDQGEGEFWGEKQKEWKQKGDEGRRKTFFLSCQAALDPGCLMRLSRVNLVNLF